MMRLPSTNPFTFGLIFILVTFCQVQQLPSQVSPITRRQDSSEPTLSEQREFKNFQIEQVVAWCIVPFDAKKRGPVERTEMLVELGLKRCAYDWRDEHVASFEQEFVEYKKNGIELFAFWGIHQEAFQLFEKYDLHPQIWLTLADPGGEADRAERAAAWLMPLAEKTAAMGCPLGLYNHGGWGGVPENMVEVCQRLHAAGHTHAGIVYNFHHGHDEIARWPESLQLMLPYLICLNLNGMNSEANPKILPIGQGQHEQSMIQSIVESGYDGPIGIIDHQDHLDTRDVLRENLDGLNRIVDLLANNPISRLGKIQDGMRTPEDDSALVKQLVQNALTNGSADRGAAIFGSDQVACVSCHQVEHPLKGRLGGPIGPDLTTALRSRSAEQIVESLLWPQRDVASQYQLWQILTVEGTVHTGFHCHSDDDSIVLRDIATGGLVRIARDDIDSTNHGGSPMPDGLLARKSAQQCWDLILFLIELGRSGHFTPEQIDVIEQSARHGAADFQWTKEPMNPTNWPNHGAYVNRDRVYDYYTKQAEHFRQQKISPLLLPAYPGLDGGKLGHWGNQNEHSWADGRWNKTILSRVQAGVFRHQGLAVTRGIAVQLGTPASMFCCFDPDSCSYPMIWKEEFLSFSHVRHGFLDGIQMKGMPFGKPTIAEAPESLTLPQTSQFQWMGHYRVGDRVVFATRIGEQVYLDSPWVEDGKFVRELAPLEEHSMRNWVLRPLESDWPAQWPETWTTEITTQKMGPIEIDTFQIPEENSWNALFFFGGHAFLPDGSALLCTMQGDVWHVSGLEANSTKAIWRRFASGLHQPLGMWIDQDGIFVLCRDQLMRLTDFNGDGEADFYECYSNSMVSSPAGHDFICDLQRDHSGNFYTVSGNQGLLQISPDGRQAKVLATGFRNPDGLGILEDGTVTVPCSEGDWTPASMICAVGTATSIQADDANGIAHPRKPKFFGYGGPRSGEVPDLPLVYLPRGIDNSSGGQAMVPPGRWGPLAGQLLHLSFGAGSWNTVLVDSVDGLLQGGVAPIVGDFLSGVHRGRFNPHDGHFYVSGMNGWGTYTPDDGCFQRIRINEVAFQHPINFHAHRNGVLVQFAQALDVEVASTLSHHFAQAWNYRYSGAYGSPEFSTMHPGVIGHDTLAITKACVVEADKLFLEIPDLQPFNQLHLRMHVNRDESIPSLNPSGSGHDLFLTIHRMDQDFTDYPGYHPYEKNIGQHPIQQDIAATKVDRRNPWLIAETDPERTLTLRTAKNLSFEQSELRVRAGQQIELTLINTDVVPHNWVLVRPGCLQTVGQQANRLIASPDAYLRQYIPESEEVLVYTDVIAGGGQQSIHFRAPTVPGNYPYLCTFPGHWMVMNGHLIVED